MTTPPRFWAPAQLQPLAFTVVVLGLADHGYLGSCHRPTIQPYWAQGRLLQETWPAPHTCGEREAVGPCPDHIPVLPSRIPGSLPSRGAARSPAHCSRVSTAGDGAMVGAWTETLWRRFLPGRAPPPPRARGRSAACRTGGPPPAPSVHDLAGRVSEVAGDRCRVVRWD